MKLISLLKKTKTVIAARIAPKQKAEIALLVKKHLKTKRTPTTLAVGDGMNDVSMITVADLGIGIEGVEGREAVRASDITIPEFSFLKPVIFKYGREVYRKNSNLIVFSIYKNIILVFPQVWYGLVSAFSGDSLYDAWMYQLVNVFYTSLAIIVYAIFEKGRFYSKLLFEPIHYEAGIKGILFSFLPINQIGRSLHECLEILGSSRQGLLAIGVLHFHLLHCLFDSGHQLQRPELWSL